MPIDRLLAADRNTPEQIELLNKAFRFTLRSLGLVDRNDPLCELVARKVIEVGKSGIADPTEIANATIARLGLR